VVGKEKGVTKVTNGTRIKEVSKMKSQEEEIKYFHVMNGYCYTGA
jgi:hypothetical protein